MELGMIGLGRMRTNRVRRILGSGYQCVDHHLQPEAVQALAERGAVGTASLEDFVIELTKPGASWMLPAVVVQEDFPDKVLSAPRHEFGGHDEEAAIGKGDD